MVKVVTKYIVGTSGQLHNDDKLVQEASSPSTGHSLSDACLLQGAQNIIKKSDWRLNPHILPKSSHSRLITKDD